MEVKEEREGEGGEGGEWRVNVKLVAYGEWERLS